MANESLKQMFAQQSNFNIPDSVALEYAKQLDAQSGTQSFTQACLADPEGFKKNIMSKMI